MFAMVWHYWIGVSIAIGTVLAVVALGAGYLKNVESDRFPKEG